MPTFGAVVKTLVLWDHRPVASPVFGLGVFALTCLDFVLAGCLEFLAGHEGSLAWLVFRASCLQAWVAAGHVRKTSWGWEGVWMGKLHTPNAGAVIRNKRGWCDAVYTWYEDARLTRYPAYFVKGVDPV